MLIYKSEPHFITTGFHPEGKADIKTPVSGTVFSNKQHENGKEKWIKVVLIRNGTLIAILSHLNYQHGCR